MHGELSRAIDFPAGGAGPNHSYKKVFMQYSGAEHEATLREPYLNAKNQVKNLRQFVCELEQHSQVRKLYIVTHLRCLNDSRKINNASKSNTSSAQACTRGSSCWTARTLWYAIVVWTCTLHCEEGCAEHGSAEFCTLRCTVTLMQLTANASVSAPVAPPMQSQEGASGAIHTGENARAWAKTGCRACEGGACAGAQS